jgi:hypothetical protein
MVELALANLLYCLDWKSAKAIDINMEEAAGLTISKKMVKCAEYHCFASPNSCSYVSVYSCVSVCLYVNDNCV